MKEGKMINDTIYREDAIRAVCSGCLEENKICNHQWDCSILTNLGRLPFADKSQDKWIPCRERAPEEAGHRLCSFKKANRIDNIYVDLAYWTGGRWYGYLANEINAWMPLPAPWKGVDDEVTTV